ncbi:hypothetical protein C6P46_001014 [Rhodotorula mucilaginosa]|uniref:Uncharacterized protein n=1 Tax=Rhodotorula mucilaginosa TaxID=5537 RepID=A0A9P7B248_RHOMI|nr:hypothetical protein C6P46_001014 [Rhodotorula mucilaginosa]
MANATPPPHKLRPSKGPSLVEIKTKHYLQCSNPITITAFTSLIAHLNSAREESDHGRRGMNQLDADRHIDQFRHEWFLGALSRVKPLELLQDGESEVYSDGRGGTGPPASTTDSLPSVLESEQDKGDPVPVPREGTTEEDEAGRRAHLVPPDAISRGLLAERTIKRALSLSSSSKHAYLRHKDFASLAAVARKAIRTTLRTHQPVYVSPGLLDGCDFTAEYRARGWAAPGIRWSVFRPDLIRFQEVVAAGAGGSGGGGGGGGGGGETGSRTVSWEVVEIKYSNKPRNFIYTNFKIQAIYYHLSLSRILSNVPHLVPSHKVTFFLSRDPLSPAYEERSVSLRTEQAFVEHHLFVLLPTWLEAVKEEEWERLQAALRGGGGDDDEQKPAPSTPGTVATGATPNRGLDPQRQTFLEKLQASIKAAPPSPSRPRTARRARGTSTALVTSNASSGDHLHDDSLSPPGSSPTKAKPTRPLALTSNELRESSALQSIKPSLPRDLSTLPPLPEPPEDEEQDLLASLLDSLEL